VHALGYLKDHFVQNGSRVTEAARGDLENLVSLVFANWN
jgi:hypothetical protein